jgi:uncharacterized membrane protein YqjE
VSFTPYHPETLAMAGLDLVLVSLTVWTLFFLLIWASHEAADYFHSKEEDEGDD